MADGNTPADAGTASDASNMSEAQMADFIGQGFFGEPEKPVEANGPTKDEPDEDRVEPSKEDENEDDAERDDTGSNDGDDQDDGEEDEQELALAADDMLVELADGTRTTVHELKRGSLREADYTRKTQELSQQRQVFEAEQSRIKQLEEAATQEREAMATVLQATMPQKPDPSLIETEPTVYMRQMAVYEQQQDALKQVFAAEQNARQQQQQRAAKDHQSYLQRERAALNDAIPEFRDEKAFGEFKSDAVKYLHSEGFTDEELNGLSDHRMMKVIRKAMQAEKIGKQRPVAQKAMEGKPRTMKAGARKGKGSRANAAAMESVNQAAKRRDLGDKSVTALLGHLLTD